MKLKKFLFEKNILSFILPLFIVGMILLPTRFLTTYSLINWNIQYFQVSPLNLFDFLLLILVFIIFLVDLKIHISKKDIGIMIVSIIYLVIISIIYLTSDLEVYFYIESIVDIFRIIMMLFIFSRLLNIIKIQNYSNILILSFIILMLSTFFLANYQQFGESRRVGSFGFGSNETALFVTTLILFLIFNRSIRLFFNYIFVFIGIISLFIIASRRAYLLLVVLFLVISFFSRRRYKITFSLRGIVVFSILTTITIIILNLGLLNWLRDSNFVNRIFYFLNNDLSFIEVSSRLDIYRQAFISIIKRPILGYLGSDSLIASDAFSNTIHAHNIFIQMILKYGILIGIGINVFLLSTLYKSFVIIKSIHNRIKETIFPIFFIVYITFDLLGYMLWNPKGLMIVIMSVVFINTKYKELVKI